MLILDEGKIKLSCYIKIGSNLVILVIFLPGILKKCWVIRVDRYSSVFVFFLSINIDSKLYLSCLFE